MTPTRARSTASLVVALLGLIAAPAAAQAAGWLPAQTLRTSTTNDGTRSVDTAVAPDGTTVVAFTVVQGGVRRAVVSSRAPGQELGAFKAISSAASSLAGAVDVAVDRQGNATAAWVRAGQVEVASRPAGQDWGVAQALTAPGAASGTAASVSMGDAGAAVVAWATVNAGAGQRVQVAFRPAGTGAFVDAGPISDPGATTDSILGTPATAMDAAGDYAVAWRRTFDFDGAGATYTNTTYSEMRVKPVSAPLSAVRHLSPYPTTVSSTFTVPSLSMTPAGRVMATWDRYDGTNTKVEVLEYLPGGAGFAAGAFTPTEQPYSRVGSSFQAPKAVLEPSGGAAILFYDSAVQVVTRSSALGAFAPARTLSGAGADPFYATIGLAANGDTVVAWPVNGPSTRTYVAARRRAGTETFSDPAEVASVPLPTNNFASSEALSVGGDDEGNTFLAYAPELYSFDTFALTSTSVYAAGYDAAPPTLAPTVPATGTVGETLTFGATAADRMSPVTLGWDFGDGGTATGIAPTHVFSVPGAFTVKASASDAAGNRAEASRVVQVSPAPPAPTTTTTTPPPTTTTPAPPVSLPRVGARAVLTAKRLKSGKTLVRALRVTGLRKGDRVSLRCTGRGCKEKATRSATAKGGSLVLTAAVKGLRLAPKAKLVVRVTRTGASARTTTFTMVRGKAPKRVVT